MYAIRNKKSKHFVYGTDYRYYPPHQRTSENKALLYDCYASALFDFNKRHCGKNYEIVPVRIEVLEDERKAANK